MTGVVRLDRRVVHHEKNKMYDSIVVASRNHKVYDCLVGVSWSVEPRALVNLPGQSEGIVLNELHLSIYIQLECLGIIQRC